MSKDTKNKNASEYYSPTGKKADGRPMERSEQQKKGS
jgi:hypothetical protein